MINIGGNISEVYVGSTPIEKAYIGSQLVWQKEEETIEDINGVQYRIKNYIQCTGTANKYIVLSKFSNTDNVEFEVYTPSGRDFWFGSRGGTPTKNHFEIVKYASKEIDVSWGQSSPSEVTVPNIDNQRLKFKTEDNKLYMNDSVIYNLPVRTFTTNVAVWLGRVQNNTQPCRSKFYYFKWWNASNNLVYDLIPVQRISDDVYGFFDKVSMTFKPSAGSEQFEGG